MLQPTEIPIRRLTTRLLLMLNSRKSMLRGITVKSPVNNPVVIELERVLAMFLNFQGKSGNNEQARLLRRVGC